MIRPGSIRGKEMEKNTRMESATWKDTVEEAASIIMRNSFERMGQISLPYKPEHKAYMALALAASETIKAFVALDESMK